MTSKKCGKRKITARIMALAFAESLKRVSKYHQMNHQVTIDGWDAVRISHEETSVAMIRASRGLVWHGPNDWRPYTPNTAHLARTTSEDRT